MQSLSTFELIPLHDFFFVFNCVALQECRVNAGSIDVHCGCL